MHLFLFNECSGLTKFPDISKWNTKNFINMSFMFKLVEINLPDISKWNVKNVKNMQGLFGFSKMESLPDISKWQVDNVEIIKDFSQIILI
jgi:surface protein